MLQKSLGLLGVVMLGVVSAGCAHTVPVTPTANAVTAPAQKLPFSVGLLISDEFVGYQYSEAKWGDTWNYTNLGQASSTMFRDGLEKYFQSVAKVPKKMSKSEATQAGLVAVIAPQVESFSFDIPFTKFQTYPATIRYKVDIFDGEALVFSKVVDGVGDLKGSPGPDFTENPSRSATNAVELGVKKAMEEIANAPFFVERAKLTASPAKDKEL